MIRVMLIEDNEAHRKVTAKLFGGHREFWLDAHESIYDAAASGFEPSVILLDICLGESDGVDTVERAAKSWPDVPIIVLTATEVNGESKRYLEAGASSALSKLDVLNITGFPVLLRALRRALGSRGHTAAEVTLSRAITKAESAPLARKLAGWALAALTTIGGGGGITAWKMGEDSDERSHADSVETKEHAAEVTASIHADIGRVEKDIARVEQAVQRIDDRTEDWGKTLGEIKGYLRARSREER